MTQPFQILMISVHPPQMPGPGGAVRTYHFAHALIEAGDVTLVCLCGGDGKGVIDSGIRSKCRDTIVPSDLSTNTPDSSPGSRIGSWLTTVSIMCFPWMQNWSKFLLLCLQYCPDKSRKTKAHQILGAVLKLQFRLITSLRNLPPFSVLIYEKAWERIWPQVLELLTRQTFDVIWLENSLYFPFALDVQRVSRGTPLVCNAQNIEFKLQERIAKLADGDWNKIWENAQAKFLFAHERRAFRNSDLIIHCSQEDMALAKSLAPASNHCVIGNGVDVRYFQRGNQPGNHEAMCLFTGTFGYPPNQDGLKFFVEEIFPLILQRRPDCQFVFAGMEAQRAYDQLGINDSRIHCISSPDDIRPCFNGVSVVVVPLRAGGGTRLKILEAMSMECAIVSTQIGAEGIPAEHGRHLLIADSPEDFADSVIALLNSPELREKLTAVSVAWVKEHYDWNQLRAQACVHLRQLLQQQNGVCCGV